MFEIYKIIPLGDVGLDPELNERGDLGERGDLKDII